MSWDHWLDTLSGVISRFGHDKDNLGRPIVRINTDEGLEDLIAHPEKLPGGAVHFVSAMPLTERHKALIDAWGKRLKEEVSFGLTGPPPELIQKNAKERIGTMVNKQLLDAAALPPSIIDSFRKVASFPMADETVVGPTYSGDADIYEALFKDADLPQVLHSNAEYKHHNCAVEAWLREDLDELAPVAARLLGCSAKELTEQISLRCEPGREGLQPSLCEASTAEASYAIRVGHGFFYMLLTAAKVSAARLRLSESEPRDITAKEINDVMRSVKSWYLKSANGLQVTALELHGIQELAGKLLPHQLLLVYCVMRGMSRFATAHELGHILMWKTAGSFPVFNVPFDTLTEAAVLYDIPGYREEAWATEIACDLLGIKLLQEGSEIDSVGEQFPRDEKVLKFHWDFVGADLALTLWESSAAWLASTGNTIDDTHPPGELRKRFLRASFPPWFQALGIQFSAALEQRLAHL